MPVPNISDRSARRRQNISSVKSYDDIKYILSEKHGLGAKDIEMRSLERPGFLSDCKRILFKHNDEDISLQFDDMMFARES